MLQTWANGSVLRSLVITAALACLDIQTPAEAAVQAENMDFGAFWVLCTGIADTHMFPSVHNLRSRTLSNNATLLLYHLMTLREMRRAIKYGHPTRIHRMLKYWMPMFYAGGSYNYANECMETLHNLNTDWPEDTAQILLPAMLVNTTGNEDGFKECDLDVEHLNNNIKARAHGTNASPDLLKNVTPAIGELKGLTDQLFHDLGVEAVYQRHHHVQQTKDVEVLLAHFNRHHVFRKDVSTDHAPVDLLRAGLQRVAGRNGGHAKHLTRHKLRLRTRHGDTAADDDIAEVAMGLEDSDAQSSMQEDEYNLLNADIELDSVSAEFF